MSDQDTDIPSEWTNAIHAGDAFDVLADLPASSVHMCMTSPPYWQLRDYGAEGQLGLEATPEEYVENIAGVMDEVKRVLRSDGSLWLNLGDTFDDKDLQQIPARVALECQSRGWVLRNRVTWAKPNPMPNSVKDRLNTTTEAIFHLTPSTRYWYDLDAIRGQYSESMERRKEYQSKHGGHEDNGWGDGDHHNGGGLLDDSQTYGDTMHPAGKNPGDVFEVTTKPFPDAHFAVYPPKLCEKPIKATCPPKVCVECGAPYEREVEREPGEYDYSDRGNRMNGDRGQLQSSGTQLETPTAEFKGWRQACDCDTDATEPGIALDPFAGAGTTLLKAKDLGRHFVGVELNPEYADMARARCNLTVENSAHVRNDDAQRGFEAYPDGGNS